MKFKSAFRLSVASLVLIIALSTGPQTAVAQQNTAIQIRENELSGVVTGPNGPEAGVWVIAETTELPTKFAKIVVTDDNGRYLIPDLPKANYSVWVRGFGLVDSPRVPAAPGRVVDLTAMPAPSGKEAAQYYPAMYWWSLLNPPPKSEFPLPKIKSQGEWLNIIKVGAAARVMR